MRGNSNVTEALTRMRNLNMAAQEFGNDSNNVTEALTRMRNLNMATSES